MTKEENDNICALFLVPVRCRIMCLRFKTVFEHFIQLSKGALLFTTEILQKINQTSEIHDSEQSVFIRKTYVIINVFINNHNYVIINESPLFVHFQALFFHHSLQHLGQMRSNINIFLLKTVEITSKCA